MDPVTPQQLKELRKFQELGKKYMTANEFKKATEEQEKTGPKGFRYYFRHPYFRLLTSYAVVFLNFYMFAEDPVTHSVTDCKIDLIGHDYAFIFTRYPNNAFTALKVFMWLPAIIIGLVVGKMIIHKWLFCHVLGMKLFTKDGQGSWMIMFLFTFVTIFTFAIIYNEFLKLEGSYLDPYHITSNMDMENATFMKVAGIGTWLGDFITAWMVTDMMLQERKYRHWMKRLRGWWCRNMNRVKAFWFISISMTAIAVTGMTTKFVDWDKINQDFVSTNELSRAFLASFILVFDLLIVMQDWDFPHFAGAMDIKLPGMNSDNMGFKLPKCCGLKDEDLEINITGKWFNYGIIFIVMILDLNMWKNQLFYKPFDFGQYTDDNGYIYTVTDKDFLRRADETMLSYDWRWNNTIPGTNTTYGSQDHRTNSKYKGYSLRVKATAFVPSLFAFCLFGYMAYMFGQEENPEEKMVREWRESHFKKRRNRRKPTVAPMPLPLSKYNTFDPDGAEENFKHQNVDDDSQSEVSSDENEDPVPMEKNFKYLLRHPRSRLIVAYFSVFLCWLMFAEDPVAHSSADSRVDVVGHAYALIFTKYPHDGYSGLKVLLWVCAILSGMILGKFLFHKVILCRILRLKIFTESGQGSWVIMFLTCVVSLFLWTFIYNEIIKLEGETHKDYLVSSNMHMKFETFMKGAATLNWFGHFTTAWMVTDVMLQEREYPHWHPLTRKWWRRSKGRIIIFWFIAIGMTSVVITAITVDFINWSDMNNGFTATSEVSRCWLASFIVVLDLLIIIQDWEFPRFSTKSKVKLPGINVANPRITFCKITLEINGKWFCYGLITIMLIIDVWNWKNQFFYEPFNYGQYTNMDNVIYSVLDREFIRTANRTTLSYKYRLQDCLLNIDKKLNSKYFGESLAEKSAAFIPALLTFVLFIYYGIKLSKEDAVRKRIRKEWQKQKAKQRAAERPPEVNLNKKNIDVEDEV